MRKHQDDLILQKLPLVKRIAYQLMARLPANVEVDDLIQHGLIGLMDAAERFDGSQGAQFDTYATQRIRGAMLDGLREDDWLPRHVRRKSRKIETAINTLSQRHGRTPTEQEISTEMGLSLADYQSMLSDAKGNQILYYEDFSDEESRNFLECYLVDDMSDPLSVLEDESFRKSLISAIDNLPEREKNVMGMYYERDMNLKEIGAVMGVSESRVCQLHAQAVARLRARFSAN